MATAVEAPKLGNTVEECIVSRWLKKKGETVSAGELVLEIETDKATFEVTAPVAGTILETFFEEGALVPVFTNLFVVGDPGESVESFRPGAAAAISEPARSETPLSEAVPTQTFTAQSPALSGAVSPRARRFAEEHNFRPSAIAGSGPAGRVLEHDVRNAYYSSPRTSPLAKRRLTDGLEVPAEGSGPAGMVLAQDLGAVPSRISNIRERIARRMRESLASTAQYTLNSSAEATGLMILRAKVKASQGVTDININDMVSFCTVKALLDVPDLNAEFVDGRIHKHREVHLGFATDTPRGLMVPVVRNAHALSIAELAGTMKELATKAFQGSIAVDDLSGATFTISNLGNLGIESFTPLLNPPQVAILGVGAIQIKPVRKDGKLEFVDSISLSLTCDHQVIDGAPGARFLKFVREKIENVESLCTI